MYWKQVKRNDWRLYVRGSKWAFKAQILYGNTAQIRGQGRKWWRRGRLMKKNYWAWCADESALPNTILPHMSFHSFIKARRAMEVMARLDLARK